MTRFFGAFVIMIGALAAASGVGWSVEPDKKPAEKGRAG